MELAVIHKGEVFHVETDIEEYDLKSVLARVTLMEALGREVKRIQEHEKELSNGRTC